MGPPLFVNDAEGQGLLRRTKVRPLPVQPVDLGAPLGAGGGDCIVGHASAEKWGVEPAVFLDFAGV